MDDTSVLFLQRPPNSISSRPHNQAFWNANALFFREGPRQCTVVFVPDRRHDAGRLAGFRCCRRAGRWVYLILCVCTVARQMHRHILAGGFVFTIFFLFLCLALLLLFAFSCFGAPCVTGLMLVEGGAFGAMNAVLYGQIGAKGVFASAVLFLLPECIRFVFFVLAARCALQTSTSLFAAQFLAKDICTKTGTRALHAYMSASIACIAAALLSGALCSVFCPVFFAG